MEQKVYLDISGPELKLILQKALERLSKRLDSDPLFELIQAFPRVEYAVKLEVYSPDRQPALVERSEKGSEGRPAAEDDVLDLVLNLSEGTDSPTLVPNHLRKEAGLPPPTVIKDDVLGISRPAPVKKGSKK